MMDDLSGDEIREIKNANFTGEKDEKLQTRMFGYEKKYFKDFTFEYKELQNLFMVEWLTDDGTWEPGNYGDPPFISLNGWNVVREPIPETHGGASGLCDSTKYNLYIAPDQKGFEFKSTLLHEMIHAYEWELRRASHMSRYLQDYLLLYLDRKLRKYLEEKQIRKLHKIIGSSLWADDGHSTLFALKSFDLDFRLDKPLGTIFSYGRGDWLKELKKW